MSYNVHDRNGVQRTLVESSDLEIIRGTITKNDKISTMYQNEVVRSGNIVTVKFGGTVASTITAYTNNSIEFATLPEWARHSLGSGYMTIGFEIVPSSGIMTPIAIGISPNGGIYTNSKITSSFWFSATYLVQ